MHDLLDARPGTPDATLTCSEAYHGQAKPGWVAVHADASPGSGLIQIIWLQHMCVRPHLVRAQAFAWCQLGFTSVVQETHAVEL